MMHYCLLTLFSMCFVAWQPWSCLSAQCMLCVSTLFSHHFFHQPTIVFPSSMVFLFTIKLVGFCQSTNWQCANHTVSEERGGDYRTMASSQGVLSEGWKRDEERVGFWLVDGVEVSAMVCFINCCQCQPIHMSLVLGGPLHVCIIATGNKCQKTTGWLIISWQMHPHFQEFIFPHQTTSITIVSIGWKLLTIHVCILMEYFSL